MSRLPSRFAVLLLTTAGCMNQPMYQPYPYGQPMYAPQNGYSQPGTLVIPPSSGAPYQPGSSTYESDPLRPDDFDRDSSTGTSDPRFFSEDAGGVPLGKDPAADPATDDPFKRDIDQLNQ